MEVNSFSGGGDDLDAEACPYLSLEGSMLTHQLLKTAAEIEAERPVWDDWVEQRYDGNPFLSLDWNLVWLKHFAVQPAEIHYVKIVSQQQPVAYFPLILTRESFHGFRVRVLRYAGNMYSPINSPLLGVDDVALIFNYFVQQVLPTISWHLFRGGNLPPEYPGPVELFHAFQQAGHPSVHEEDRVNWVYHNEEISAEEYHRQLPRKIRQDIRKSIHRLEEAGDFHFRFVTNDLTPKDVEDYMKVYRSSWKKEETNPELHPDLMEVMARRGLLRLGIFYLDQRPIATLFWFLTNRNGYAVKMAYDDEYKRFNPGKGLMWLMIERLMTDDHMVFFDFLKGDHDWKRRWTNIRRERSWILAFHKGATGNALHLLDQRLLPLVRRNKFLDGCKNKLGSWIQRGGG